MKKLIAVLVPLTLALTACVSTNTTTGTTGMQSTTQQLGNTALKIAINAKCTTELNNTAAWQRIADSHMGRVNVLWADGHATSEKKEDVTPHHLLRAPY